LTEIWRKGLLNKHIYYSGGESYGRGRGERESYFGRGGRTDWGTEALEMEVASSDVSRIIGKYLFMVL